MTAWIKTSEQMPAEREWVVGAWSKDSVAVVRHVNGLWRDEFLNETDPPVFWIVAPDISPQREEDQ